MGQAGSSLVLARPARLPGHRALSDGANHSRKGAARPEKHTRQRSAALWHSSRPQPCPRRAEGRREVGGGGWGWWGAPRPSLRLPSPPSPWLPVPPGAHAVWPRRGQGGRLASTALLSRLCCQCRQQHLSSRISRQMCSQTLPAPQKGAWHMVRPLSRSRARLSPALSERPRNAGRGAEQRAAADGYQCHVLALQGDPPGPPWSLGRGHGALPGSCAAGLRAELRKHSRATRDVAARPPSPPHSDLASPWSQR